MGREAIRIADRFWLVPELGAVFDEIYEVVDYPFSCRPKPRMTRATKWSRGKTYFAWCRDVSMHTRVRMRAEVDLGLVIRAGIRTDSDVSNCLKAVEDALAGLAYKDDSIKHVRRSMAAYVPAAEPSFTVILGRYSCPNI